MRRDMDLIHRFLDGEISEEERKEILSKMDSDLALKEEFNEIEKVIRTVKNSAKLTVPSSFTFDVMKRLPVRKDSYIKLIQKFIFKERTLRWNMITAVAAVCLAIIVFGGVFKSQKKQELISNTNMPMESTITVKFNLHAPDAKKVSIAGDFNKWKVGKNILKRQENGIWTIEIPLKPGTYNYMFVVDGKVWVSDPNAEAYQDDGFGYKNSVMRVNNLLPISNALILGVS